MNVQDIMTSDVQCCGPDTNLAAAAKMMWDTDFARSLKAISAHRIFVGTR